VRTSAFTYPTNHTQFHAKTALDPFLIVCLSASKAPVRDRDSDVKTAIDKLHVFGKDPFDPVGYSGSLQVPEKVGDSEAKIIWRGVSHF